MAIQLLYCIALELDTVQIFGGVGNSCEVDWKKCYIFLLLGTLLFQLGITIEPTNIVGSWCMSCMNISLII